MRHGGEEFIPQDHGGISLLDKDYGVENDDKVEDLILVQDQKEDLVTLEKISVPETMAEFLCWRKMMVSSDWVVLWCACKMGECETVVVGIKMAEFPEKYGATGLLFRKLLVL